MKPLAVIRFLKTSFQAPHREVLGVIGVGLDPKCVRETNAETAFRVPEFASERAQPSFFGGALFGDKAHQASTAYV